MERQARSGVRPSFWTDQQRSQTHKIEFSPFNFVSGAPGSFHVRGHDRELGAAVTSLGVTWGRVTLPRLPVLAGCGPSPIGSRMRYSCRITQARANDKWNHSIQLGNELFNVR